MFRLFKPLAVTAALALCVLFITSCGSGNNAQVRVVNAIVNSDSSGLDIDVNGTKYFTAVTPGGVQPTPPSYTSVPSGNVAITAFDTGQTGTTIASGNAGFSGSTQYTVVLDGSAGSSTSTVTSLPDNNTAPTTGNVEFRIINASQTGPTAVDIYVLPNPSPGDQNVAPNVLSLQPQQASSYLSLNYTANGYNVIVTPTGVKNYLVNENYSPATGGIITLVLPDNPNQTGMSAIPIQLNDLQ